MKAKPITEHPDVQKLIAKMVVLQAQEKRSNECIIWHSKELSKVKTKNKQAIALLEKAKDQIIADYDNYHLPIEYIEQAKQALAEAEKIQ